MLNAPTSFEPALVALDGIEVVRSLSKVKATKFALVFVVTQMELDLFSKKLIDKALGDALLWIAYPKKTSKKYQCEFNRDSGWRVLGEAGFEAVRMVAIDEDWSALRFRRVEFIKSLTRDASRAKTVAGKSRAEKNGKH